MEKELDLEIIKATQNSLGKYVKRPPLSEKLLKKPPFRFLHDIVTTVLKTTGFFEGVFDENELISENVKDRESKLLFLNKVISVLSLTTGKTLSVKPSKIVAGQEPEKTNELLQCLASALDKKLSSDDAVKKFKESSKTSQQMAQTRTKAKLIAKNTKTNSETKQLTAKSSEKLISRPREGTREKSLNRNEKNKITDIKIKKKDNEQVKLLKEKTSITPTRREIVSQQSRPETKTENQTKKIEENIVIKNEEAIQNNTPVSLNDKIQESFEESKTPNDIKDVLLNEFAVSSSNADENEYEKFDTSNSLIDNDLNSTSSPLHIREIDNNTNEAVSNKTLKDSESNDLSFHNNDLHLDVPHKSVQNVTEPIDTHADSNEKSSIKDTVYRKQDSSELNNTSKLIQNDVESITRPMSVRPSSSRPGAPRLREKPDNFASEMDNVLLGKVYIISENACNEEEEDSSLVIVKPEESKSFHQNDTPNEPLLLQNKHGHLVQQILDSQKELSGVSGKTEIEWEFGAQRAKDAQYQEIEQLRFSIQALSRVANPLGKLLDHFQEDIEVMRQELQQWNKMNEEVSKEISKQRTLREDSLQPLHVKLKQLDVEIEEKVEKLYDMKILIAKNANRIEKLLAGGGVK